MAKYNRNSGKEWTSKEVSQLRTFAKENTSIEDVLGILEKSSDFYFLYNGKLVDVTQKVTINIENELLEFCLLCLFSALELTKKFPMPAVLQQ